VSDAQKAPEHLEVLWSHSSMAKVIEEIPQDVVGYSHLFLQDNNRGKFFIDFSTDL
jgi:hypothetical protein